MNIDAIINQVIANSNKTMNYYLQGGCYIFAKTLKNIIHAECEIIYLLKEFHFVLNFNNKLYDASGNVTKKYKDSIYISEEDFLKEND